MGKGWITISRSLQEHWVYEEDRYDHAHAWIDLLLLANFADKKTIYKGEVITCKRGDVNYSMKYLAERWGWSWRAVKHFLSVLESDNMITTNVTTNRTVISIVNYEKFQFQNEFEQCEGHNESHNEGNNEGHNEHHNEGQNEGHINKELKKEKNIKKNIYGEYKHVLLTKDQFDKLVSDYGEPETLDAIKFLDEYIEMKGYKAKNHNLAMRKWVFDAVKQEKAKNRNATNQNKASKGMFTHGYDFDELEKEMLGDKP